MITVFPKLVPVSLETESIIQWERLMNHIHNMKRILISNTFINELSKFTNNNLSVKGRIAITKKALSKSQSCHYE